MENQDKIYEQFKEAAGKTEQKGFDRMEAVWNRVEEKLDEKKKRRPIAWWKYTGAAAVLVLFVSIGNFLMRNDADPVIIPNTEPERVVNTVIDTQKVKETFNPMVEKVADEAVVVNEPEAAHIYDTLANGSNAGRALPANDKPYGNNADIVYKGRARFTTSKDAENPEYYFNSNKIKFVPGSTNNVDSKSVLTSPRYFEKDAAEPAQLEEVVVMGYQAKAKRDVTAATTVISAEEISKASVSNMATVSPNASNQYPAVTANKYPEAKFREITRKPFDSNGFIESNKSAQNADNVAGVQLMQTLQGKIAGIAITNAVTPAENGRFAIRDAASIRNNAEPLFIVDGIPLDRSKVNELDTRDIDSYQILKGSAGSSIYGSRGANGVILITTRRGDFWKGDYKMETVMEDTDEIRRKLRSIAVTPGGQPPLYIVDGVQVDEETFKSIEIEKIAICTVLKNPAETAKYGSRGRNGVVKVTTSKIVLHPEDYITDDDIISQYPSSKIRIDTEDYESFEENQFENPAISPLSTFSIDVDNASYTNVRRFLNNGQTVPKDAVRVEEMINFFKYQYPQPTGNDAFSINTEYSDAPWNPKHKLLKIGLKGKDIPAASLPASNFVFLIDVSGSMNDSNKLPLLKQSMKLLVNQMRPQDRIAIVVYAGAAGLVLPSTSGSEKNTIINALNQLEAGGSTAGGAGIELAYKTAQENFVKGGNNRVILATDGDFNVGASSNSDMQTLIEAKRKSGVFLTCLGYGMGNYKDSKMEILADKGNGNYAYIDNMQEADRFLQKEFKGSMFAIAKDVKIQIEFNPKHVQSYRLIGYENRKLRDEDFANDAIDAGELGSGHTVTALYEIIPAGVESSFFNPAPELKYSQPVKASGNYTDELATIKFRHKKPDEDVSKETVTVIPNVAMTLGNTSGDFKFAAAVAWFGLKLRDSKLIPNKETKAIIDLAKQGQQPDPEGYRAEFIRLVNMVE